MIKISVIIPIHDQNNELDKCLYSVCNQIFNEEYEILCILDSPNYECIKIVNKYKNNYSNLIKTYYCENHDVGLTRNLGIDKAKGKYLFFLDGDDFITFNCLSTLFFKSEETKADLTMANYSLYMKNNKIKNFNFMKLLKCGVYNSSDLIDNVIEDTKIRGFIWNKLFKKDMIINNKIRFLPYNLVIEDRPFLLLSIIKSKNICVLDENTYFYVQHKNSIVNSTNKMIFLQKYINSDFLCKIILKENSLYNAKKFNHLLIYRLISIKNKAKRLDKKYKLNNEFYNNVLLEIKLLLNDKLFIKNTPWEKVIKCYNCSFENFSENVPFNIKDLGDFL